MSPLAATAQQADTSSTRQPIVLPDSSKLRPYGGVVLSNDSLLRWQQWSGFGEWASRQPRFTTQDLGGYGRNAGIRASSFMVNTDRVRWNGVIINNPLSGQYNSAEIPFGQLGSLVHYSNGISEFEVNPQTYAVLKPLTVIRYEQSSYEYRNLDGLLAMPISDKWMVQASYQGQKDDGKYARSNYVGRRSTGNIRYKLNSDWSADAFWLYQGAEMQESMGFQYIDPLSFSFDRFRAQARSGNTASMRRLFLAGVILRPNNSADGQGVTLYRKLHRHEWRMTDTAAIRSQEWGLSARYQIAAGKRARFQPYLDAAYVSKNKGDVVLAGNSTNATYNIGIRGEYSPVPLVDMLVHGEILGGIAGKGSMIDVAGRLNLPYQTGLTFGHSMSTESKPSIYDAAMLFRYNVGELPRSNDASTWYAHILKPTGLWRYHFDYRNSSSISVLSLSGDNQIVPILIDRTMEVTGAVERHSDHTEVMIGFKSTSATYSDGIFIASNEQRLISSVYWKGYLFDNAAFLKGGAVLSTTLSDSRPVAYLPEFGIWLPNTEGSAVPAHHRLDLEFAFRVRSMILTGRVENTLDGWTQKGYFQTLPYPMPGRRFRIGLKVHFRD